MWLLRSLDCFTLLVKVVMHINWNLLRAMQITRWTRNINMQVSFIDQSYKCLTFQIILSVFQILGYFFQQLTNIFT